MESKICVNCGEEFIPNNGKQVCCSGKCNVSKWRNNNPDKAKEAEHRNNKKRRGVYRYNPEQRANWYANKKEDLEWKGKINSQSNERRNRVQEFIRNYKLEKGCADCGYKEHHAALDFDHIDGEKELNVCNAKSISQAKNEIEKCEVVCANCHRIRTFERLQK